MIMGDDVTWLNSAQLKWDTIRKKICEQAGIEADHKSRIRELLDNEGKDGKGMGIKWNLFDGCDYCRCRGVVSTCSFALLTSRREEHSRQ